MTVLWVIVGGLLVVAWVLSVVDIFRRQYSGWTTVGWLVLIVILPFIGSLIYWRMRQPTSAEAEQEYLAEADRRRSAGSATLRQHWDGAVTPARGDVSAPLDPACTRPCSSDPRRAGSWTWLSDPWDVAVEPPEAASGARSPAP
jgi:hypothetical protein